MQFMKSILILSVFALLLPAFVWAAYPAEVPRTGQTKCYNESGTAVIDCAGTGQDGNWLAGVPWPDPRFIDNGDGTVTDKLTGLVWAKNANLQNGALLWQDALNYVADMNSGIHPNFGHTDWRLPNVNELESLVHAGVYNPTLSQGYPFTNVQSGYYWSSTSNAFHQEFAWNVDMDYGFVNDNLKSFSSFVWPIRAGQCGTSPNSIICLPKTGQTTCYNTAGDTITCSGTGQDGELQAGVAWPDPRFSVQSDNQTVTDNLTGLVWAKNANIMVTRDSAFDTDGTVNDGAVTWQHAFDYVAKLNNENYLNHADWRVPNRREFRSLADYARYNPALAQGFPFTNVQPGYSWSSTSYAYNTFFAWIMDMYQGYVYNDPKLVFYFVWPVRAGQVGNAIISTTTTTPGSSTTTSIGGTTTTTTTTGGGKLCPAKNALGENSHNLEYLRAFRDNKLAQSAVGRKIISIYYNNADSINAAIESSPALKAVTRSVLEVIAPMVGKN